MLCRIVCNALCVHYLCSCVDNPLALLSYKQKTLHRLRHRWWYWKNLSAWERYLDIGPNTLVSCTRKLMADSRENYNLDVESWEDLWSQLHFFLLLSLFKVFRWWHRSALVDSAIVAEERKHWERLGSSRAEPTSFSLCRYHRAVLIFRSVFLLNAQNRLPTS